MKHFQIDGTSGHYRVTLWNSRLKTETYLFDDWETACCIAKDFLDYDTDGFPRLLPPLGPRDSGGRFIRR